MVASNDIGIVNWAAQYDSVVDEFEITVHDVQVQTNTGPNLVVAEVVVGGSVVAGASDSWYGGGSIQGGTMNTLGG